MRVARHWYRVILIAAAFVWPGFAQAQSWLAEPGALGAATVSVGHATLKLPPGNWQTISEITTNPLQQGGDSLYMSTKLLAQVSNGHLDAMIMVSSNVSRSPHGWREDRQCHRRDVLFFSNASESDRRYDCFMVNHQIVLADNPSNWWVSSIEKIKSLGATPRTMLCAVFAKTSSSRLDYISVHVCVNPIISGFPDDSHDTWAASDWNKVRIGPDRRPFVDKVTAWAEAYRPTVAGAF